MKRSGLARAVPPPIPGRFLAAPSVDTRVLVLVAVVTVAVGLFLRLWHINTLGFNSDEAVYAGQAAAIVGDPPLSAIFPIFRAHPLLFQFILSLIYGFGVSDLAPRLLAVAFGLATVLIVYLLGARLYGRAAGLLAALFMAVMPYHVIVSRQALLDVPMVFFSTLTLLLLARFAMAQRPGWLYASGAALGLTFLSKETGIVLLPAIYAFLALSPSIRVRIRDVAVTLFIFALVIAPFPISLKLGGGTETAHNFLAWQLFRPANHEWTFYPAVVPSAIGLLLVAAAAYGYIRLSRRAAWKERLLLSWMVVPVLFFQLWPVKGFQYLLPIAPVVAILAAAGLTHAFPSGSWRLSRLRMEAAWLRPVIVGLVSVTLIAGSWVGINAASSGRFLAGSGGVPGGRAAGQWLRTNIPAGSKLLAIGPSMANILQFYGHHPVSALSVSTNPLHRNPAYDPVHNPDLELRSGELQYVVWDAFSANRSSFFETRLLRYVSRYHGRIVHTESIDTRAAEGEIVSTPVIVIYQVRP